MAQIGRIGEISSFVSEKNRNYFPQASHPSKYIKIYPKR
jgi:hypothetical protein